MILAFQRVRDFVPRHAACALAAAGATADRFGALVNWVEPDQAPGTIAARYVCR